MEKCPIIIEIIPLQDYLSIKWETAAKNNDRTRVQNYFITLITLHAIQFSWKRSK